jgi:hypothetical protein
MNDERLRDLYQNAIATRAPGTRLDCPPAERLLALARREGSEADRLRTLDHTMSCGDCMRELELLRVIEKAGDRIAGPTAQVRQERFVSWRRAVPLALAASLVLAVGLVVRERGRTDVVGSDRVRGADSALAVHVPRDVTLSARDSLVVAWAPVSGATRFVVEVLDDGGRTVLSESTTDTVHVVRDLGRLTPGREYRWWVRALMMGGAQRSSSLGRLRVTTP